MAPSSRQQNAFEKDEKVLCFHGQFLYEAKILDLEPVNPKDRKSEYRYRVHYKGWKNTWDDWVPEQRLRKLNEENRDLAKNLQREYQRQQREEQAAKKASSNSKRKSAAASDLGSFRDSEERSSSAQGGPRGTKRGRDYEIEKEETFTNKPAIRIPIPDHLKGLLVDDWENITKSLQLVPLPHPHPVTAILDAYHTAESPKRRPGSADSDVLEEVIQGVREYFDRSLGRILLYRFERQQWLQVSERINGHKSSDGRPAKAARSAGVSDMTPAARLNNAGSDASEAEAEAEEAGLTSEPFDYTAKTPAQIYGAEHLCRLFVSLPELVAHTNMDAPSVARLREELTKMTNWMGKNAERFFVREYLSPGNDYIDLARGA